MEQVRATAENSIAVEDSVSGVKSAIAAGLKTFAFTGFADNPEQSGQQLINIGCLQAFQYWQNFPKLLQHL